jgi:hypothetical protein
MGEKVIILNEKSPNFLPSKTVIHGAKQKETQ